METNGRKKVYKANKAHPLYPELKSVARKCLGLDRVKGILWRLGFVEKAFSTGDYDRDIDSGIIDLVIIGQVDSGYLEKLVAKAEQFFYYDPFIPEVLSTREHAVWTGTKSIEWDKEIVSNFDAVLISTNHSAIDYAELAEWSECLVDTRNAMNGIELKGETHIFKA